MLRQRSVAYSSIQFPWRLLSQPLPLLVHLFETPSEWGVRRFANACGVRGWRGAASGDRSRSGGGRPCRSATIRRRRRAVRGSADRTTKRNLLEGQEMANFGYEMAGSMKCRSAKKANSGKVEPVQSSRIKAN